MSSGTVPLVTNFHLLESESSDFHPVPAVCYDLHGSFAADYNPCSYPHIGVNWKFDPFLGF